MQGYASGASRAADATRALAVEQSGWGRLPKLRGPLAAKNTCYLSKNISQKVLLRIFPKSGHVT